ncbi:hypothetical protein N7582_004210 [Saccharomyces uvarum]|uniref:YML108W-like protein n=1 Tax=Saccharomyces uvarum TaxID=230603 RepID=A0AA35J3Q5_SACUV|nr:hypothetical protein N7582_004210 [Saccharomyces uvarum]CAI4047766.1 hypothetical protein SUVC_13G0280 [Saccharomyces uvarum]
MAKNNTYRMLVLLEDDTKINKEDEKFLKGKPGKMHEFVDELMLPFQVDELDELNVWFDKFDAEICIPNEGHIKYEISSDGLIVLMLDKEIEDVVEKVKRFVEENI